MSQRFAGRPIAVAVEQSRGALVFLLASTNSCNLSGAAGHDRQLAESVLFLGS